MGRYAAISMTGITSAAAVLMRDALGLARGNSVIISSASFQAMILSTAAWFSLYLSLDTARRPRPRSRPI